MKVLRETHGEDNTVKYLIGLDDLQSVEALYMCYMELRLTYYSTVCVSSQVGCAAGCRFCATGKEGFVRNLTACEILALIGLLRNRPLKLIISRYNDNKTENLTPADTREILAFYNKIKDSIDCGLFHNFGGAIQGGCGQLRRTAYGAQGQVSYYIRESNDEQSDLRFQFFQQYDRSGVFQRGGRAGQRNCHSGQHASLRRRPDGFNGRVRPRRSQSGRKGRRCDSRSAQ